MRKTVAALLVAALLTVVGCSKYDNGKGGEVKVDKKGNSGGGY